MGRHRLTILVPALAGTILILTAAGCHDAPPEPEVPMLYAGPWMLVFHSDGAGDGSLYGWTPGDATVSALLEEEEGAYAPRWDGSRGRLTYLLGEGAEATLWTLDAAGASRALGPNPGTEESVVWSPDGRWRLYSAREGGRFRLFLQGADGQGPATVFTPDQGNAVQPAWSPDGSQVAFTWDREGQRDLWIVPREGGSPRNVTRTPEVDEGHPAWSPDGDTLVFDAVPSGSRDAEIVVQARDGTGRRSLTADPAADLVPSWSPAGDWIAFGSSRGGSWDIWVVRPDGSELTRVTTSPGFDGDPRWVPSAWMVGTQP